MPTSTLITTNAWLGLYLYSVFKCCFNFVEATPSMLRDLISKFGWYCIFRIKII